jgi:hypothetical protein
VGDRGFIAGGILIVFGAVAVFLGINGRAGRVAQPVPT